MAKEIAYAIEIPTSVEYWFIRSDGGDYFDTYLAHGFIAIGWNHVTPHMMDAKSPDQVKEVIDKGLDSDLVEAPRKKKITSIYNKIKNFTALNRGDIILVPSSDSSFMAIGQIVDDRVFTESVGYQDCKHTKRRRVKWLTGPLDSSRLDPMFMKIRAPWHAISKIAPEHHYYIESLIYDVYEKDKNSHLVLRVKTTEEINLLALAQLLESIHDLLVIINKEFDLREDVDSGSIRLNLQSPGLLNFKMPGKALVIAALTLGIASCNPNQQPTQTNNKVDSIVNQNRQLLDKARHAADTLNINL